MPANYDVANETQLNAAIGRIDRGGASATPGTASIVKSTSGFALAGDRGATNLESGQPSLWIAAGSG
jgi:hypothetical protein